MNLRAWAAQARVLIARAVDPLRRRARDRRLDEEIGTHLDMLADELVAGGMSAVDARLEARRQFGGVDQVKLRHQDQRGFMFIDAVMQDMRFAVRMFARDRLTTFSIVGALALGIGATVTVFTILNAMLLQDVPFFREPDRVVIIDTMDERGRHAGGSLPDLDDWRRANTFSGMGAYSGSSTTLAGGSGPADSLNGVYVTAGTVELLGAAPAIGRTLTAEDERSGAPLVVLLSHGVWTDRFGSRPDIVGQAVRINGASATIVGVMPAGFTLPLNGQLWLPASHRPGANAGDRSDRSLAIVARLADEVTLVEARAELETIAAALSAQYPDSNRGVRPLVVPFVNRYMGYFTTPEPLLMLSAAVVLLLLACANASSLLVSRSATRAREIALRAAMGASRRRIIGQLLVESLLLAAAAGVGGFAMASGAVRAFASTTGNLGLPAWIRFQMDATVFVFVAAVCLGTAAVFGCVPALHLSHRATTTALKDGGRGVAGSVHAGWATRVLLAGQVAVTLVLLSAGPRLCSVHWCCTTPINACSRHRSSRPGSRCRRCRINRSRCAGD